MAVGAGHGGASLLRRSRNLHCRASPLLSPPPAAAAKRTSPSKPEWAGDAVLSKLVNALIATPGLYDLMKVGARQTMIQTAEKNGVAWRGTVAALEESLDRLDRLRWLLTDASIEANGYPDYYTQPFHAYAEGNLNWLAAQEAEPATYAMALRVWPTDVKAGTLSWQAAQQRLRDSYVDALRSYMSTVGTSADKLEHVLDVGCSVGVSTRSLSAAFPGATRVTGMDLSPYMLAVAAARDEDVPAPSGQTRIWRHGFAEDTGFEDSSIDLFSASFLFHELPQAPARAVMAEAARVLRPGGVFAMTDNNPGSAVIQGLPPAIFTLMKSTEPHSDAYYAFDVEAALAEAGFTDIVTVETDPRHRAVFGIKGRGTRDELSRKSIAA